MTSKRLTRKDGFSGHKKGKLLHGHSNYKQQQKQVKENVLDVRKNGAVESYEEMYWAINS